MTEPNPAGPKAAVPSQATAVPVVSDHKLIRIIGAGSGGQVWLASNVLGSYRAIKVVYASNFRQWRPFEREFNGILKYEPVSRLHDGLVDILQVGHSEDGSYFYYVMELADDVHMGQAFSPDKYVARTLAHEVDRRRRLPIGECVRLGAAIASALGFLHRNGLVHRDIKPANIIFVNGFPKLADIGLLMEISEDKAYVGTTGFIPPEGPGTLQADIYSLGKVLYEISTGLDRNKYPELPPDLESSVEGRELLQFNKIVWQACRTDPRNRFKSAEEMMTAILSFQFGVGEARKQRTHKLWVTIVGIFGIIFAASVFAAIVLRIIWLSNQGQ